MAERKGDWLQTFTRRKFYPLDPRTDEVCIEDIAHALALTCRFAGHCQSFYSVAQHSYISSYLGDDDRIKFLLLLHDASEAYIHDIVTPLKPFITNYKDIESNVMDVIHSAFGVKIPIDEDTKKEIKRIDKTMLATECKLLMITDPKKWNICKGCEPIPMQIECHSPEKAEKLFLQRFYELKDRYIEKMET